MFYIFSFLQLIKIEKSFETIIQIMMCIKLFLRCAQIETPGGVLVTLPESQCFFQNDSRLGRLVVDEYMIRLMVSEIPENRRLDV